MPRGDAGARVVKRFAMQASQMDCHRAGYIGGRQGVEEEVAESCEWSRRGGPRSERAALSRVPGIGRPFPSK